MANAVARAYSMGLGAVPQWVMTKSLVKGQGAKTPEAESY